MPQNFEDIVRPFTTGDTAPPQRYITAGQASQPPAVIIITASGGAKVLNGSYSFVETFYCDQSSIEQRTET